MVYVPAVATPLGRSLPRADATPARAESNRLVEEKEARRMRYDLPPKNYDVSLAPLRDDCRYGESYYREDCHFAHPDSRYVCSQGERCYLANSGQDCGGQHPPLVGLCCLGNGCYLTGCSLAHDWNIPEHTDTSE